MTKLKVISFYLNTPCLLFIDISSLLLKEETSNRIQNKMNDFFMQIHRKKCDGDDSEAFRGCSSI